MTNTYDIGWQQLCRVTKYHPFFLAPPVHCCGGAKDVVRERRTRLVGGAVTLAVTIGLAILAWHLMDDGNANAATYVGIIIWTLFVAGFGIFGLLVLLRVRRLEFDRFNRSALVYSGYIPFVKRSEITAENLDVNLSADPGSNETVLTLHRNHAKENAVELARAAFKSEIELVYKFLRQWFAGGGRDETLVSVTAPNGKLIELSTTPINPTGANFQTACLKSDSRGRLAIRATPQMRAFWLTFAAMGAMFLVIFFPEALESGSIFAVALAGGLGTLFLLVGILGFADRWQLWRFSADCNQRTVALKPGILAWNQEPLDIGFDQVAAVQLCSRFVDRSEDGSYASIELNLVLCDPPGMRIPLMSHGDGASILQSARALEAALERPLLDHRSNAGNG